MIIGNGLIANAFLDCDNPDVVFFASGVSNSLEKDSANFLREQTLLEKIIAENNQKKFIYFSTCSIYDSSKNNSLYIAHKLKMERYIIENCSDFLILRISNAVGKGGNKNTLINFFVNAIKEKQEITIYTKATRNLVDVEDIKNNTLLLIEKNIKNKIINIAYPINYYISELVAIIEIYLGTKAVKKYEDNGGDYSIDIQIIEEYYKNSDHNKYLEKLLMKYY